MSKLKLLFSWKPYKSDQTDYIYQIKPTCSIDNRSQSLNYSSHILFNFIDKNTQNYNLNCVALFGMEFFFFKYLKLFEAVLFIVLFLFFLYSRMYMCIDYIHICTCVYTFVAIRIICKYRWRYIRKMNICIRSLVNKIWHVHFSHL